MRCTVAGCCPAWATGEDAVSADAQGSGLHTAGPRWFASRISGQSSRAAAVGCHESSLATEHVDLWSQILGHVGFLPLADWAVHFTALVWYRALHATLAPPLSRASKQLPARQRCVELSAASALLRAMCWHVLNAVCVVGKAVSVDEGSGSVYLAVLLHGMEQQLS